MQSLGAPLRATAILSALLPALVLLFGAPAHGAALRTSDASSRLVLPAPATLAGDDGMSVIAWVHVDALPEGAELALVDVGGVVRISVDVSGAISASFNIDSPERSSVVAGSGPAISAGGWALVCASWDASAQVASVWSASESHGLRWGEAGAHGARLGAEPGPVRVGADGARVAIDGVHGLIAIRDHPITPVDMQAMWASRRYHAPFITDTLDIGGRMNGEVGCVWMIGHAATTFPKDGLFMSSTVAARAAVIGRTLTATNTKVYLRSGAPLSGSLDVVRPVLETEGMVYESPFDVSPGFFVREIPEADPPLPSPPFTTAVAPRIRALALGEAGHVRVMSSANSRGVKTFDGSGESPGNYAHGFIGLDPSSVAGVLNRPALLSRFPWFGFDSAAAPPFRLGTVNTVGAASDYTRFWGAAGGVLLRPGAQYALRCKPEGMITADAPLIVRAHALRFPGAADLLWTANKHTRQNQAGQDIGLTHTIEMDTTRFSAVWTPEAGDDAPDARTIALVGDDAMQILPGDACAVRDALAIVESVAFDAAAGATVITLRDDLNETLHPGDTLRFGEWELIDVEHEWPALAPGDNADWRGLKLRAGEAGAGVVVFAFSAWNPNAPGAVWGVGGRGGEGYTPQLAIAHPEALREWMRRMDPHIWLQMFAQQESGPTSMNDFADAVLDALPDVELAWLGDLEHSSQAFIPWHRHILVTAPAWGVPAVSLLQHPDLGARLDQLADGLRADGNHLSQRGNERLAALWLENLRLAALADAPSGIPGDVNGDGVVDFADLSLVLGSFGQTGDNLPGDANGDGVVDFADLALVLTNFGASESEHGLEG
ncbi:MAG: hypothetical protein EA379_10760 [Phycisphaerales bacterium]|nr:MAG: hypothetical protein EA379_10760 [Phycisphaerales bacterium]